MHVTVNAFGKINIFLDVVGKREDGYHEVKMIMQSVRLHDVIEIARADENAVFTDSLYVPNNRNNLAMRAALLLQEQTDMPQVSIRIKKNCFFIAHHSVLLFVLPFLLHNISSKTFTQKVLLLL